MIAKILNRFLELINNIFEAKRNRRADETKDLMDELFEEENKAYPDHARLDRIRERMRSSTGDPEA